MADDIHRDGSPPFDKPLEGEDAKTRVYGAVLHAREPTTVSKIAEWADCSADSARTLLSFYSELGIVIRHEDPVRYQRNNDYFEWRRIHELAQENAVDELESRVAELTDCIAGYRDKYDADSPAEVNVLEFESGQIEDVYIDLGDWATAIKERRLYKRARKKAAGSI